MSPVPMALGQLMSPMGEALMRSDQCLRLWFQ